MCSVGTGGRRCVGSCAWRVLWWDPWGVVTGLVCRGWVVWWSASAVREGLGDGEVWVQGMGVVWC